MRHAFTLVELLVVVSIIVVLIALLAPALDRAIYQTQLAVCGAQIRGVVSAVVNYAAESNRFYPARPSIESGGWMRPDNIRNNQQLDDRPYLSKAFPLKALIDPFCLSVDLDHPMTANDTQIFSPYPLWFGMRYPGGIPLRKLGSALTWTDTSTDSAKPSARRTTVLVSDQDFPLTDLGILASHPDSFGKLANTRFQDQEGTDFPGPIPGSTGYFTLSRWLTRNPFDRGTLDTNYGFTDGSVRRYNEVGLYEPERMARAPRDVSGNYQFYFHLPIE